MLPREQVDQVAVVNGYGLARMRALVVANVPVRHVGIQAARELRSAGAAEPGRGLGCCWGCRVQSFSRSGCYGLWGCTVILDRQT